MVSPKSTFVITLIILLQFSSETTSHVGHDDGARNSDENLHGKGLILVKVWCLIIMFATTFTGGVLPYFFRRNESFLEVGSQFGGGVFLGIGLMHFLSDATATFGDLTEQSRYPFSSVLACAGYFLAMLGDILINKYVGGDRAEHNPVLDKTSSVGGTILLILALCSHSVFDGISVGVTDTKRDAWRSLWPISLYTVFAAIAMGIALLRMIPKRPFLATIVYSFAFAISSPVGVGIGIAIDATNQSIAADWIYIISTSLACGVLMYVAINHLISKGFKPQQNCYVNSSFFKFLALILGAGVIAVAMLWG